MRANRRGFLRLTGGLGAASLFAGLSVPSVSASDGDWEKPRHGPANTANGAGGPQNGVRGLWSSNTGVIGTPIVADGTVYAAEKGYVRAFDRDEGTTLWEFDVRGSVDTPASYGAHAGGTVYVTAGSVTYAIDAEDGTEVWRHRGDRISASAANFADGRVYLGKSTSVYALGANSGSVVWEHEAEGVVSGMPAVAGGTVYAADEEGYVYAIDAEDGFSGWRSDVASSVAVAPVVANGSVFVIGTLGKVASLDTSGNGRWSENLYTDISQPPAVDSSRIYVGTENGNLHALRESSGWVEWSFEPEGSPASAPAVGDGTVYVGVDDTLYAVDGETGEEVWRHEVAAVSSPAAVGEYVFVGGASRIHALYGGVPSPEISITGVETLDSTVSVGESVSVAVELENTGEEQGSLSLSLYADGELVGSKEADVGVKEERQVEFTTVFDEPGERSLNVNTEDAGTVTVRGEEGAGGETEGAGSESGTEEGGDTDPGAGTADGGTEAGEATDGTEGDDGVDGADDPGAVGIPGLGIGAVVVAVGGTAAAAAFKAFRAAKDEEG